MRELLEALEESRGGKPKPLKPLKVVAKRIEPGRYKLTVGGKTYEAEDMSWDVGHRMWNVTWGEVNTPEAGGDSVNSLGDAKSLVLKLAQEERDELIKPVVGKRYYATKTIGPNGELKRGVTYTVVSVKGATVELRGGGETHSFPRNNVEAAAEHLGLAPYA